MSHGVKRGATLIVALEFTPEEWARLTPITEAMSKLRVGDTYYNLTTRVDDANRLIHLRAETSGWKVGIGYMDAAAIHGDTTSAFPHLENIAFPVAEGVTL